MSISMISRPRRRYGAIATHHVIVCHVVLLLTLQSILQHVTSSGYSSVPTCRAFQSTPSAIIPAAVGTGISARYSSFVGSRKPNNSDTRRTDRGERYLSAGDVTEVLATSNLLHSPPKEGSPMLLPDVIISEADRRLDGAVMSDLVTNDHDSTIESLSSYVQDIAEADALANRRRFMGSILLAAGTVLGADGMHGGGSSTSAAAASAAELDSLLASMDVGVDVLSSSSITLSSLQYEALPVNKRFGVSLYDPEKSGFNVKFITYLSRFLLVFDRECQKWWYTRAGEIPRKATFEQVNELRLLQFASFSASVEVGLLEYRDPTGPRRLLQSLVQRYCPSEEALRKAREQSGEPPLNPAAEARQQREIKEARRQIALLFGLMTQFQPVEEITSLLAGIDNATVTSVVVSDPGSGYAPGYGPPRVTFCAPAAGSDFPRATGRAVLRPSGRLLRIDLAERGQGYTSPPKVVISPPAAPANGTEAGSPATARAFIFTKEGPNKGKIERIQLDDPGKGYVEGETINVDIETPPLTGKGSRWTIGAAAKAILEYEVGDIVISNGGAGYPEEKPIEVIVEPPPVTARVNMNDPMMAGLVTPGEPLPVTIPSAQKILDPDDPTRRAKVQREVFNSGKGGGGGCFGRACYDRPVVAYASVRAERDSYDTFREADDASGLRKRENELAENRATKPSKALPRVSGLAGGGETGLPSLPGRSSSQLLNLFPAGIGLVYDTTLRRYVLARGGDFDLDEYSQESPRPLDPEFGPRGRSPVERNKVLDVDTFLRFVLSGAICCSGAHLVLTPIDVVKTKVQTNPKRYPNVLSALKTVADEEGIGTFFNGWAPTFLGFFINGGLGYSVIEYLRRLFTDFAGPSAAALEIPIILSSALISASIGSVTLAPFETVRIRAVAQPDFADNTVGVLNRIVKDEGVGSLFTAVPAFLPKEILFVCTKFLIFDLTTDYLYQTYPAASEDLKLSLLISLVGGTLGGVGAAIMSNPADATISEMKKSKSDVGPLGAAQALLKRGGIPLLFRGLGLRMFFYALIVSIQFLVYDYVRYTLNIGSDDLKLYLDVLGGALSETGGPE